MGAAGRRAEEHVGAGDSGPADPAARRARASPTCAASTKARRRSASPTPSTTVDGIEGRAPYPKKVTKVCQVANLYPQYFQVVALDRREDQFVRRPQGQVAGHAAEGQHRRAPDRRGAEAQRHDLPVALQGELPGRRTPTPCRHDEGRPRAGVHARHHGAGVGGDGPRERARREARAGRRQDDGRAEARRTPATTSS